MTASLLTAATLAVIFVYNLVIGIFLAFAVLWTLASGGPLEKYCKFIQRGVVPFLFIAYAVTLLLEFGFHEQFRGDGQRWFLSMLLGGAAGLSAVLLIAHVWTRMRLHWLTLLNPRLKPSEALRFLKSLAFGINYPVFFAEGDKSETTLDGGPGGFLNKVGGPGMLVAQHGCAVVLESGGRFTRVAKGVRLLKVYEQPKAVVDLRQRRVTKKAEGVLTLDGTLVDIDVTLWYQIKRKPKPQQAPGPASAAAERPTEEVPGKDADHSDFDLVRGPAQGEQTNKHRQAWWRRAWAAWQRFIAARQAGIRRYMRKLARFFYDLSLDEQEASETRSQQALGDRAAHDSKRKADVQGVAGSSSNPPDGPGGSLSDGETMRGHVDYLDIAMAKDEGEGPPARDEFEIDDEEILRAIYKVADWKSNVESMVIHILRDVVAERTLDQLVERDPERSNRVGRVAVRNAVLTRMAQWLEQEKWGVEVVWVDIGQISVPPAAQRRMLDRWLATWEVKVAEAQREAIITRGEATAVATSAQEAARARASVQLINSILEAIESAGLSRDEAIERVVNLRIIDALEKMASEHVNGFFLPAGLLEGMSAQRLVNKIDGDGTKGPPK